MNLTKLQRNLYKEMKKATNVEQFNKEYKELLSSLPEQQKKHYDEHTVFVQGYAKGTPQSISYEERMEMMKKAGYKQISTERTCLAFDKVAKVLYEELF